MKRSFSNIRRMCILFVLAMMSVAVYAALPEITSTSTISVGTTAVYTADASTYYVIKHKSSGYFLGYSGSSTMGGWTMSSSLPNAVNDKKNYLFSISSGKVKTASGRYITYTYKSDTAAGLSNSTSSGTTLGCGNYSGGVKDVYMFRLYHVSGDYGYDLFLGGNKSVSVIYDGVGSMQSLSDAYFDLYPVTVTDHISVTGLKLDKATLSLPFGNNETLTPVYTPSNANYHTSMTWASSDEHVASVSAKGVVTAKGVGTATITGTSHNNISATCKVTVTAATPAALETVDLGLPSGTLWTNMNVGATAPEQYGDFYAWGETLTKDLPYTTNIYKWNNGTTTTLTKYCFDSKYGIIDSKSTLDPADDAAYKNWGTTWRTPSEEQYEELVNNCSWEWTTVKGVPGSRFTGCTGKSIFIPAGGYIKQGEHLLEGEKTVLWTNTLDPESPGKAYDATSTAESVIHGTTGSRYYGRNVRPVSISKAVRVTSITLSQEALNMEIADESSIIATVVPADAAIKTLVWTSSDEAVATVTAEGVVTAVGEGIATITVAATDGSGVKSSMNVEVAKKLQPCAAPVITYESGKVKFTSSTPEAKCYYTVKYGEAIDGEQEGDLDLTSVTLTITAYAKAEGYKPSEAVTKVITIPAEGLRGDVNKDGKVTVADAVEVVDIYVAGGSKK